MQEAKNQTGTYVFGVQVDRLFVASLPTKKIAKAIAVTSAALLQKSLSLEEVQRLTGYLSFCPRVVRLGWVFMRPLLELCCQISSHCKGLRQRLPAQV